MKQLVRTVVTILTVFGAFSHCAATDTVDSTNVKNSRDWSLQFKITDNFSLHPFDRSFISLQKKVGNRAAIRFGIGLSIIDNDRQANEEADSPQSSEMQKILDISDNVNGYDLSFTAKYLYQLSQNDRTTAYLGIGPNIAYSKTDNSRDNFSTPGVEYLDKANNERWEYAAELLFGAEWRFYKNLNLLAEYSLSAGYYTKIHTSESSRITNETDVRRKTGRNSCDGFQVRSNDVKFGLSVYF